MFAARAAGVVGMVVVVACGSSKPAAESSPSSSEAARECREAEDSAGRPACEQLVDHLAQVIPGGMSPDREQDVCDCLAMPKALVDCWMQAETAEAVDTCVDTYVPRTEAPTVAECEAAVEHLEALGGIDSPEEHAAAVDGCVRRGTPKLVRCVRRARTLEEAEACVQ